MSTTSLYQTPARATAVRLNLERLRQLSAAAEGRSEQRTPNLSKEAVEALKGNVKGQIVLPSDAGYDEVRQVWNAMIDRRPALIVRCAGAPDVPHAIAFARAHGLELSIRGGGHNIAGTALCEGGLTIDFSAMR